MSLSFVVLNLVVSKLLLISPPYTFPLSPSGHECLHHSSVRMHTYRDMHTLSFARLLPTRSGRTQVQWRAWAPSLFSESHGTQRKLSVKTHWSVLHGPPHVKNCGNHIYSVFKILERTWMKRNNLGKVKGSKIIQQASSRTESLKPKSSHRHSEKMLWGGGIVMDLRKWQMCLPHTSSSRLPAEI